MSSFGDFGTLCSTVTSYPWCNLFYRQLLLTGNTDVFGQSTSADPNSAPVGINTSCGITRYPFDTSPSLLNIANIIATGLSILITLGLVFGVARRKAAVGRIELQIFLVLYGICQALELVDTGAFLRQGDLPIVIVTAIHAGVVAALFWALLWNGILTTQIVDDGSVGSLAPYIVLILAFFAGTAYTAFDIGLHVSSRFGPFDPVANLRSIPLFVLTSVWPLAAAFLFYLLMVRTTLLSLKEFKPFALYTLAAVCFILANLGGFLLGQTICRGTNAKVDASFVATVLDTLCVLCLYFGWRAITEESWDEEEYFQT